MITFFGLLTKWAPLWLLHKKMYLVLVVNLWLVTVLPASIAQYWLMDKQVRCNHFVMSVLE